MKHVIETWTCGRRECWECDCGRGGSVGDGDVEVAAEKHVSEGDQVAYRRGGGDR